MKLTCEDRTPQSSQVSASQQYDWLPTPSNPLRAGGRRCGGCPRAPSGTGADRLLAAKSVLRANYSQLGVMA
jgi:hypothetical protein